MFQSAIGPMCPRRQVKMNEMERGEPNRTFAAEKQMPREAAFADLREAPGQTEPQPEERAR
jgi:hypothetical protein